MGELFGNPPDLLTRSLVWLVCIRTELFLEGGGGCLGVWSFRAHVFSLVSYSVLCCASCVCHLSSTAISDCIGYLLSAFNLRLYNTLPL